MSKGNPIVHPNYSGELTNTVQVRTRAARASLSVDTWGSVNYVPLVQVTDGRLTLGGNSVPDLEDFRACNNLNRLTIKMVRTIYPGSQPP